MQQSGEASWGPSTRPKRQVRPPSYLRDYAVNAVRPKKYGPAHGSPAEPVPRGEEWSSQPHVTWSRTPQTWCDYFPSSEESFIDTSLGWLPTFTTHTEEGAESSGHRESVPHSFPSPYDANKESRESTASVRMRGTVQRDQTSEQWPVPPLPPPQDSLALEEEEYDEGLPPPPWPLSDNPPKSTVGEEQRVVIVIDRMMSELQLMKDSVSSSIAAHTHSHSTPWSLNLPQPRRGPEDYDIRSSTQRPNFTHPLQVGSSHPCQQLQG